MSDEEKKDDVLAQLKKLQEEREADRQEIERLRGHVELTLKEKRELKEKADAERQRLEDEKLRATAQTKEEADNIAKQWREKAEAYEKQLSDSKKKEQRAKLLAEAQKLAEQKAKKDPGRAKLLAKELVRQMSLDEDGKVVVLDENKRPTISTVDSLLNDVSNRYPFLCDGLDSSGGGAHSNAGKPAKKFSEMTTQEKNELYRESPEKYEQAKASG